MGQFFKVALIQNECIPSKTPPPSTYFFVALWTRHAFKMLRKTESYLTAPRSQHKVLSPPKQQLQLRRPVLYFGAHTRGGD